MFVASEEESSITAVIETGETYRATDCTAVLVIAKNLFDTAGTGVRLSSESVAGVEGIVAEKLVERTMEAVGAHLGNDVDDAACGLTIFSLESVGFNAEFFDRIGHGDDSDLVMNRGCIDAAIEEKLIAIGWAAVDADLREILIGDLGKAVRCVKAGLDAGDDLYQVEDVTAIERELFNAFAFDGSAKRGVFSLDAGNFGGDVDRFCNGTDVQLDIDAKTLGDFEIDVGLFVGFEAGGSGIKQVAADGKLADVVGAVLRTDAGVFKVGGAQGDLDLGAGDASSILVGYRAGDGA